jgi:hypothetical protein
MELGEQGNWLLWLFAAVVIFAVLLFGAVVYLLLRPEGLLAPDASPTPSRPAMTVAVTASATRRPTALPTQTPIPTSTWTPTPTPTITPTPSPTPDVILLGVQALGELSTVQYSLKTVVEKQAEQPGLIRIGGLEILKPRLHFLLIASGQVKAGVDFREMVRYEIQNDRVTVYLPAPRITDYAIDPTSISLHYLRTDFGLDEKFVVERYNEAVIEAQESLRNAALESNILEAAENNARTLVQSLIQGLGFSQVKVRFLPPTGAEIEELEVPLEQLPIIPFQTATPQG